MSATTGLLPISTFAGWLAYGERGLSSEAIMYRLTGGSGRYGRYDHPWDPADLRRCLLFLDQHPEAGLLFKVAMRGASKEWDRLLGVWDELVATLTEEVPNWREHRAWGSAPRTYALMKRSMAGGVTCDACGGTGKGIACEKCKGTGRRGGGRCRADDCYGGHDYCRPCRGRGYTGGDR